MNLSGQLDATWAAGSWHDRVALFAHRDVDMTSVTGVDSAGLALLVTWAKADASPLRLQGSPEQLSRLMMLYGVESLFSLTSAAEEVTTDATGRD